MKLTTLANMYTRAKNVEPGDSPVEYQARASTWTIKLGVKYNF